LLTANRVLQLWLAVRAINLFIFFVAEHSSLHTEARLLVDHLCDTAHNRKITGALVDCSQARTLVNSKSFVVTYAMEKTVRTVVLDCWTNATHGLASLVQLLGLLTTLVFTSALCLQNMYLGAQRIRYARSAYGESYTESLGIARRITPGALRATAHSYEGFGDEVPQAPSREKFD
jgi:hypothetical protein